MTDKLDFESISQSLKIRNIVLCGVFFFLVFKSLLGFTSARVLLPAYLIVTFAFLLNFLAYLLIKNKWVLLFFSYLQFILDLIVILLALYFSGGLENSWGVLLSIVVAISGLYFSIGTALFVAAAAIVAFATLIILQYQGIIPHFSAYGLEVWNNLSYIADYLAAMFVLYVGAAFVSGSAGYHYKKRKEETEAYARELHKKIETIEKINQELMNKYGDIEKLNQLFIGRELEMIKLKEEISRLRQLVSGGSF